MITQSSKIELSLKSHSVQVSIMLSKIGNQYQTLLSLKNILWYSVTLRVISHRPEVKSLKSIAPHILQ